MFSKKQSKTALITATLLFAVANVFAQTNSFNLSWDANSEPDVYEYHVYRALSAGASERLAKVAHPQSSYSDNSVDKGVQYFYRLKAFDYSLNGSEFSDELSVAIPKISGLTSPVTVSGDTTITINLNEHVVDPDDANETLTWAISGASILSVSVVNNVATIIAPAGFSSQETLVFSVKDDQNFEDRKSVVYRSASSSGTLPPVFTSSPSPQMQEDSVGVITLSDFVEDPDSDTGDLVYSVDDVSNLGFEVNGDQLTVTPAANWFGQRTTQVTVTDAEGNSDQASMQIVVNAVNDAPVLSALPQQSMGQNSTVEVDLSDYASDVDNEESDLSWSFTGYSQVTLQWNETTDMLQITSPPSWQGFEYVRTTVEDPDGASVLDTLVIRVSGEGFPPQINGLPDVAFNEDGSAQLQLNNFVSDGDDPLQNLFWRSRDADSVKVTINHTTNVATFSAQKNWNGEEDIWMIVNDPDQNADSTQIKVTVSPVNDRPMFATLPSLNMSSQLTRQIDLAQYSSDVDDADEDLTWSAPSSPDVTVSIGASGTATFTVAESWFGQEEIVITVRDDENASDTSMVTVYRQNPANSPRISGIEDLNMPEDDEREIDLDSHVSDADHTDSELTWSFAESANLNLTLNSSTRVLTVAPKANWNGREDIFLKVTDPDNYFAFDTVRVVVSAVNDAPTIASIGTITMLDNSFITLDLTDYINEPDGYDDLTQISLLASDNGFVGYFLDRNNLELTFFSPAGYYGRETFLLRVTDNSGQQASTVFTIDVLEKNIDGSVATAYLGAPTNITLSWKTKRETKDFVEYGLNSSYGFATDQDDVFSTTHTHIISDLQENTTYHFRIASQTTDGKISYSADSTFTTGGAGDINVFPVPYRASEDINENGVFFTNLPQNSELLIYNLLGEPVFRKNELGRLYRWQIVNNNDKKVSSGVYVYVIKDEKGKKVNSGKMVVVR